MRLLVAFWSIRLVVRRISSSTFFDLRWGDRRLLQGTFAREVSDPSALVTFLESYLSCWSDWSSNGSGDSIDVNLGGVDFRRDCRLLLHRAVARDVASLATAVASLARSAQGTSVGSGAILRDVTELAASITLHSLRLAVPSKVVGTTALIAGSRTRAAGESSTAVAEATSTDGASTTEPSSARIGAVALRRVSRMSE